MLPLLKVSDVSVSFGGLAAVDGVGFEVFPNECLGLIGSNGAGKSTLVDVICGARVPRAGTVEFIGQILPQESPRGRARRGIARTFQGLRLFYDLTVRENILVRAEALGASDAKKLAKQVMQDLALKDVAHWPVRDLPLARQKIVALGQAIVTSPRLTILDEPMAGLDEHGVGNVQKIIHEQVSETGRGIVLIDHNVTAVAAVATRLVFMHSGKVVLTGPTQDVLRSKEVAELYFGKMAAIATT